MQGKTIAGTNIEMQIYELVIQQLALWIFVKENLSLMFELDPKFTLDICYMFFIGLASDIIKKYHQYIKINIQDSLNEENQFVGFK